MNDLITSYVTRDRVIVPSLAAFMKGGRVLAALGAREGVDISRAGSLVGEVLIAASCREATVRLVTANVRDFAAIQRHLRGFRCVAADEALS